MLAFLLSSVMTLTPTPGATTPAPAPSSATLTPEAPGSSAQPMQPRLERPVIRSINPPKAPHGAVVFITGKHFTGATRVTFGRGHKAEFKVISAHRISALVPYDASSARIRVITANGGAASSQTFQVTEEPKSTN